MPYSNKRITRNSRNYTEPSIMNTASHTATPRSTYQAWGGFREPQDGAYPVKSMWKGTVLVTNADGNQECFAIGPDGYVWSYETGVEGQGAGRLVSTGVEGDTFGLGVTGGGLLVVLAVGGGVLRCAMETYDVAQRWSEPVDVIFPARNDRVQVEKVITQTRGDNLFIGFIVRVTDESGVDTLRLWEAVWAGTRPVLAAAPVAMACGHAFWTDQLDGHGDSMS